MAELCLVSTQGSLKHVKCVVENGALVLWEGLIEHHHTCKSTQTCNQATFSEVLQLFTWSLSLGDLQKFTLNMVALLCVAISLWGLTTLINRARWPGSLPGTPATRKVLHYETCYIQRHRGVIFFKFEEELALLNGLRQDFFQVILCLFLDAAINGCLMLIAKLAFEGGLWWVVFGVLGFKGSSLSQQKLLFKFLERLTLPDTHLSSLSPSLF